jgi:sulfate permease, SulP family
MREAPVQTFRLPAAVQALQASWFSNVRVDLVSGLLVALALIPEAIGFSIVAGVDPRIGLYTSFTIAVTIAFAGGRPGMISAATGSMAVVLADLVRDHGLAYLFATTVLTGIVQVVCAQLRIAQLMRFVPRSVMVGFVCALAIFIFTAQLPQFEGANWQMYAMVAAGLAIIHLLPRFTTVVPSPLVAIVVLTAISIGLGADVRTVGDMGALPTALPTLALPVVLLTLDTLAIVVPYALILTTVGLLESLLTAQIVDDMTDTPSDKNRETLGQGIANVVTGLFGGMAGCAMIGQSVINIRAGGRTRLSTLSAGILLLFLILVLGNWVARIPLGALAAVMFTVAFGTFDWAALKAIRVAPRGESVVTVATVATVIQTHDLALGVLVGVLLSAVLFARRIAHLVRVESRPSADGTTRYYRVVGQIFFASVDQFVDSFDFSEKVGSVEIGLEDAHLWDSSAVAALDKVLLKFSRNNVRVRLVGLNQASESLLDLLGVHRPVLTTRDPSG